MSILDIKTLGDPILMSKAEEVTEFDSALSKLIDNMQETTKAADGVGLAAPQVGVGLRLFTYDVPEGTGYIINPVLEETHGVQEKKEGCLSVPGVANVVERPTYTRVSGVNLDQEPIIVEGEDLLARVLQHELDHLDGKLYLRRLLPEDRKKIMKDLRENDKVLRKAHKVKTQRQNQVNSSFYKVQ